MFDNPIANTVFWAGPPLCWCLVFANETTPLFGLPQWVHFVIHLAFWAYIVRLIWRAQSITEVSQ